MRVLVVSNMWPSQARPALGTFVRDQVEALGRRDDVELEHHTFAPGGANYLRAVPGLVRRRGFDVVHAHFGLTAIPALAAGGATRGVTLHGTDMIAPRSRRLTHVVLPRYDVLGVPSEDARRHLAPRAAHRAQVLPCGIDLAGFAPVDRREARRALGLDPSRPFVLFPYDPGRTVKRHDRAVAAAGPHPLHALGHADRGAMRLWLSAASVVLCPADWETFGMAATEALACGTAVVATPTGAHAETLGPARWATVAPFEKAAWRALVDAAIEQDAQHADGPGLAAPWSSDAMAGRLVRAWTAARHRGHQG